MKHGDKIVFPGNGEGSASKGSQPGDLVFIIQQSSEHGLFKRQGCDLIMEKKISLLEALTGVDFIFEHLGGEKVRVKSAAGDVSA